MPGYTARRDTEFVHQGMPTGATLFAWLPEKREKWVEAKAQQSEDIGRMFGQAGTGERTAAEERAKEF